MHAAEHTVIGCYGEQDGPLLGVGESEESLKRAAMAENAYRAGLPLMT